LRWRYSSAIETDIESLYADALDWRRVNRIVLATADANAIAIATWAVHGHSLIGVAQPIGYIGIELGWGK